MMLQTAPNILHKQGKASVSTAELTNMMGGCLGCECRHAFAQGPSARSFIVGSIGLPPIPLVCHWARSLWGTRASCLIVPAHLDLQWSWTIRGRKHCRCPCALYPA